MFYHNIHSTIYGNSYSMSLLKRAIIYRETNIISITKAYQSFFHSVKYQLLTLLRNIQKYSHGLPCIL